MKVASANARANMQTLPCMVCPLPVIASDFESVLIIEYVRNKLMNIRKIFNFCKLQDGLNRHNMNCAFYAENL